MGEKGGTKKKGEEEETCRLREGRLEWRAESGREREREGIDYPLSNKKRLFKITKARDYQRVYVDSRLIVFFPSSRWLN